MFIRKRGKKWQSQVRIINRPCLSKSFKSRTDAKRWSVATENKIRREDGGIAKINFNSLKFPIKSEDIIICHYLYKEMIDNGIRFAPPKLAAQFSMENVNHLYGQDVNSVFGFHGKHLAEYF